MTIVFSHPAPFDVDFHLLLNLAVGGNLPGPPDSTSVFPQEYIVDYVRVYQVPNSPPVVTLTSPDDGDTFAEGSDITMPADVDDNGGILYVEFYQGAGKVGVDDTEPYELTLPSVPAGCYSLTAKAKDEWGAMGESATADIMVGTGCPQAP